MKKIEAIIRNDKFLDVDSALRKIGVSGLTIEQVTGRGRTRIRTTIYARGVWKDEEEYVRHVKLEIITPDADAEKIIDTIIGAASTGSTGDGKIFVSTIEKAIDIGSRETGEKAVVMH